MQTESRRHEPILKLSFRWESTTPPKLSPVVSGALERVLLFDQLSALYRRTLHLEDDRAFHEKLLQELGVHYEVSPERLGSHPPEGPGGRHRQSSLRRYRGDHPRHGPPLRAARRESDGKLLLGSIPELRDLFILVDPFAGQTSTYANVRGLREALTWLKGGRHAGGLPGRRSFAYRSPSRTVTDPEWDDSIARIIRATGASALPVFSAAQTDWPSRFSGLFTRACGPRYFRTSS